MIKTMTYETEINGIKSRVWFSEENISGLFLPLLRTLTRLKTVM